MILVFDWGAAVCRRCLQCGEGVCHRLWERSRFICRTMRQGLQLRRLPGYRGLEGEQHLHQVLCGGWPDQMDIEACRLGGALVGD